MEIANSLDTSSKYVYYSYVIADSDHSMSTAAVAAAVQPSLGYATAQQQYPVLVQQCIIDGDDTGGDSPATQTTEAAPQTTQNVLMTAAVAETTTTPQHDRSGEDDRSVLEFVKEEEEFAEDDDMSEHYEDEDEEEDYESEQELTSLAWLSDPTRSSVMNMFAVTAVGDVGEEEEDEQKGGIDTIPAQPVPKQRGEGGAAKSTKAAKAGVDENLRQVVNDKNVTQERFNKFMLQVQQSQTLYAENELAYRTLSSEKPPFNYAQIIAMAMMECGRMTLKDICTWIRDRFAYYRSMDNWNNSIRHNLSLHFCFTKIARDKTEKGKGGYWELSMNVTKGEKKRVRNRSKRALAAAASNGGAPLAKRPRRATGSGRFRTSAAATTATARKPVTMKVEQTFRVDDQPQFYVNEMAASEAAATPVANDLCTNFGSGEFAQIQANMMNETEIYLGCEIPLSGDCIIIPYNNNNNNHHHGQPPQPQSIDHTNAQLSLAIPTSQPTSPTSSSQSRDSPSVMSQAHEAQQQQQPMPGDGHGDLTAATLIAHGLTPHTMGPNVIVESLPYGGGGSANCGLATAGGQSVFDQVGDIERQFSSMVQLPDPELVEYDVYYDFTIGW